MIQLEVIELATKQVKRTEYTKHPFSKKRLRVLDSFPPAKRLKLLAEDVPVDSTEPDPVIACPACQTPVDKILVVESDAQPFSSLDPDEGLSPQAAPYHVLCCSACNSQSWYVILS